MPSVEIEVNIINARLGPWLEIIDKQFKSENIGDPLGITCETSDKDLESLLKIHGKLSRDIAKETNGSVKRLRLAREQFDAVLGVNGSTGSTGGSKTYQTIVTLLHRFDEIQAAYERRSKISSLTVIRKSWDSLRTGALAGCHTCERALLGLRGSLTSSLRDETWLGRLTELGVLVRSRESEFQTTRDILAQEVSGPTLECIRLYGQLTEHCSDSSLPDPVKNQQEELLSSCAAAESLLSSVEGQLRETSDCVSGLRAVADRIDECEEMIKVLGKENDLDRVNAAEAALSRALECLEIQSNKGSQHEWCGAMLQKLVQDLERNCRILGEMMQQVRSASERPRQREQNALLARIEVHCREMTTCQQSLHSLFAGLASLKGEQVSECRISETSSSLNIAAKASDELVVVAREDLAEINAVCENVKTDKSLLLSALEQRHALENGLSLCGDLLEKANLVYKSIGIQLERLEFLQKCQVKVEALRTDCTNALAMIEQTRPGETLGILETITELEERLTCMQKETATSTSNTAGGACSDDLGDIMDVLRSHERRLGMTIDECRLLISQSKSERDNLEMLKRLRYDHLVLMQRLEDWQDQVSILHSREGLLRVDGVTERQEQVSKKLAELSEIEEDVKSWLDSLWTRCSSLSLERMLETVRGSGTLSTVRKEINHWSLALQTRQRETEDRAKELESWAKKDLEVLSNRTALTEAMETDSKLPTIQIGPVVDTTIEHMNSAMAEKRFAVAQEGGRPSNPQSPELPNATPASNGAATPYFAVMRQEPEATAPELQQADSQDHTLSSTELDGRPPRKASNLSPTATPVNEDILLSEATSSRDTTNAKSVSSLNGVSMTSLAKSKPKPALRSKSTTVSTRQQSHLPKPIGARSASDPRNGIRPVKPAPVTASQTERPLKLDEAVEKIVKKSKGVTVQKVKGQSGRYLIGNDSKVCFIRILPSQQVMVRVGGGWSELSRFLAQHSDSSKASEDNSEQILTSIDENGAGHTRLSITSDGITESRRTSSSSARLSLGRTKPTHSRPD